MILPSPFPAPKYCLQTFSSEHPSYHGDSLVHSFFRFLARLSQNSYAIITILLVICLQYSFLSLMLPKLGIPRSLKLYHLRLYTSGLTLYLTHKKFNYVTFPAWKTPLPSFFQVKPCIYDLRLKPAISLVKLSPTATH